MTNFMHTASGILPGGFPWSFTLKSTGSISEAAAQTLWAAAINSFFTTAGVAALYSTAWSVTSTSTSTASASWKQTTKTTTNTTHAGTAATQELPDQMSMIVTARTANATKSGHGRMYFPAPVAAALAVGGGGLISAGSLTTLAGALSTQMTTLVTGGLSLQLLTRKATLNRPALSLQTVTGLEIVNKLGVQRRRADKLVVSRTTVAI